MRGRGRDDEGLAEVAMRNTHQIRTRLQAEMVTVS